MNQAKKAVKKIFRAAGFDVRRNTPPPVARPYYDYDFETDETFKSIYRRGIKASGSTHDPEVVHQRLYNTVQFLRHTLDLEGDVAECGVFRGLGSYIFCNYLALANPDFIGQGYHVFDSFEGLSQPSEQDVISKQEYGAVGTHFQAAGAFHGQLETVKAALRDYPLIQYHAGWIPESFAEVPERSYKFVHVDLDLYEPIKGALEYFYPRMVPGGVIVIDEYAIPRWPGARTAADEFCQKNHLVSPVSLTTGNGVLIKK
jgi:O-methyltransferase